MKVKKAGTHGKHGAARMRAMGKMADMPAEKPAHTPGGRLTAEGRKELRQMMQPRPKHPMGQHAFIMVGTEMLFLAHMTMFHMEEHCYQLVLRVRLPAAAMRRSRAWRRAAPKQTYFLANLAKNRMSVPELQTGAVRSFLAEVYKGIPPKKEYTEWPWEGETPVMKQIRVSVERVVYSHHFDLNFEYPKNLTYVLFGAGREAHMQSYQTKEPDYDHVVSLVRAPRWRPKAELEAGVTVNFPAMRSRPVRLSNPLARGRH